MFDWIHDTGKWLSNEWNGPSAPAQQNNPYNADYGALIDQLKNQAAGKGVSLGGNAFAQATAQGAANQQSMTAGGGASMARLGAGNASRLNQGLTQGVNAARTQEMASATAALPGVMGAASDSYNADQDRLLRAWQAQQASDGQRAQTLGRGIATLAML